LNIEHDDSPSVKDPKEAPETMESNPRRMPSGEIGKSRVPQPPDF
jgi:hypothetical protein